MVLRALPTTRSSNSPQTHTDAEIAAALNAEGLLTQKQKPWSARRVLDFRVSNAIPSGLTASPTMRLEDTGYITSTDAAHRLDVDQTPIQTWFHWGVLSGKQDAAQRQLWISWDEDVERRLCGTAPIDSSMISVKRLCNPGAQTRRRDPCLGARERSQDPARTPRHQLPLLHRANQ